jgi:L-amino acid N-acyltransferase YncA
VKRQRENTKVRVRLFEEKDEQRILDILNMAIADRRVTALLTPATRQKRAPWFAEHRTERHPIFVAEVDGRVVGWMAVTAYRSGREGFSRACELSYYLDKAYQHQGIGTVLMDRVIARCRALGYKHLMLIIFEDNLPSLSLARKFGFEPWGLFPGIVEIDGHTKDCFQMGRAI